MPPHKDEDELYAEADELFDELDEDGSGDLDREEVVRYLVQYGYNDDEATALIAKMQLHGGGAQSTVSKAQFREIYAVFITDLAERGLDIARREQDINLARRGYPAAEVEAYSHDFLLDVADCAALELISELLAARWEELLRARGYSAQSAMEVALALEIQMVEEEVLMIVRPEIEGRADEIRRLIDKKLAHKDITEKLTKDVRRDMIIEVIEEELLGMTLPGWRAQHLSEGTESKSGDGGKKMVLAEGGKEEGNHVGLESSEPAELKVAGKQPGMLCEIVDGIRHLRACARRQLQQPVFFAELEHARAMDRCMSFVTEEMLEAVLEEGLVEVATHIYRIMMREKASEETVKIMALLLDKVAENVSLDAKAAASHVVAYTLDESYRRWRIAMAQR